MIILMHTLESLSKVFYNLMAYNSLESPDLQASTQVPNDEAVGATIQEPPAVKDSERRRPWIRYRTELRHRFTGALLSSDNSNVREGGEDDSSGAIPILELITRYDTTINASEFSMFRFDNPSAWMGRTSASAPTYSLKIYSQSIINALKAVVQYYPGQDLSGTPIEVKWPYAVLVHHYDQLLEFKLKCQGGNPSEMCVRKRDAPEHIEFLLQFLDENIMERVRVEQERLSRGFHTFENMWVPYKPGRMVGEFSKNRGWRVFVVSEVVGGIFANPPTSWTIQGWHLDYNVLRYSGNK